jgi:hypothetical protein
MNNAMPTYSLKTIREVARHENKIILLGRKVESDMTNLGYFKSDIATCLRNLRSSNFYKTLYYENANMIFDVYKARCLSPLGRYDEIYIKLKLNSENDVFVEIGAFHLL